MIRIEQDDLYGVEGMVDLAAAREIVVNIRDGRAVAQLESGRGEDDAPASTR